MAEPWHWCDCSGVDPPCGCGQADCFTNSDDPEAIHWRDQHWRIGCAFDRALAELDAQTQTNLKLADKLARCSEVLTRVAERTDVRDRA